MNEREDVAKIASEKGYKTDGNRVTDLSFYKKEVNLIALASYYGYSLNAHKTGRGHETNHRFIIMDGQRSVNLGEVLRRKMAESKDPMAATNRLVDERIMISKNQAGMFQFSSINNSNPFSKGSCFDFIMYHNPGFELKDCIKELNSFILSPDSKKDLSLSLDNASISNHERDKAITEYGNIGPLKDISFLITRGIAESTIRSNEFQKSIYNAKHTDVTTGKSYVNIAFPLVSETSISGFDIANDTAKGFDIRNTGIKSTLSDKGGALWKSYIDLNRKVPKIVLSESPIDGMSYHELKNQGNKNNLYLSSCGYLSDTQISLICKFFNHTNPNIRAAFEKTSLVCAQDKDLAGGYFTCKILNQMDAKLLGSNIPPSLTPAYGTKSDVAKASELLSKASFFPSTVPDQNYGAVCIVCPTQGENSSKFISSYLLNSFNVLNSQNAYEYSENKPFTLISNLQGKNSVRFEVGWRNDKNQWGIVNNYILQHKFGDSSRIRIEQPVLKDFNDDLRCFKNMGNAEDIERFNKRNGPEHYNIYHQPNTVNPDSIVKNFKGKSSQL